MANIIVPPGWRIPEREATPEPVFWNRKAFLRTLGLGAAAVATSGCGSSFTPLEPPTGGPGDGCNAHPPSHPLQTICPTANEDLYPPARDDRFELDRPLTDRIEAATYNNFYEFIGRMNEPNRIWDLTGPFRVRPWSVEIAGEVENPGHFDVEDLEREFGLEERLYRLRCVEAWAIAVPWAGFPLSKLIEKVKPLSTAQYVRFVSFDRPEQAVGQAIEGWYPWPYYEALRMDEAMNELTMVATGVYGEPLPKQHGAPLRIVAPWKYGFKSPKSVHRIEFLVDRPSIFWSDVEPDEYGFYSIVNPDVPHPRWSQGMEEMLGTGERRQTLLFNGYGEWVADLYNPELLTFRS